MTTPAGVVVRVVDSRTDAAQWARLRKLLWPEEDGVEDPDALAAALAPAAASHVVLATASGGLAIGFAEAKLRSDYVNGTETSPVGFLEGWFVDPAWRGRGVGRAMLYALEDWARERGCTEFASDALLDNFSSHAAHRACGFEETERVVYFRKSLAR